MFNHIIVPLDGSVLAECVLPHLRVIARGSSAEVTLLRVLDPAEAAPKSRPVDPFDWQIQKAEAESYLKDISQRLQQAGLPVQVEVQEGRAAETIIDYAQARGADLLLMSSHGQSGLSGWNVSGVVQKIILRARTSVMIVRAYQAAKVELDKLNYQRILLPLDGSPRAEVVLPYALAIAQSSEADIIVTHIVRRPELPRRTPPSTEDLQLADQLTERNRQEASSYLEELKPRLGDRVETRLIIDENVSRTLYRQAEEEKIDLVILSAHGHSGETRWPYGSVVISFIAYGTTPLLVIQDVPAERIELSPAEAAAREKGGR